MQRLAYKSKLVGARFTHINWPPCWLPSTTPTQSVCPGSSGPYTSPASSWGDRYGVRHFTDNEQGVGGAICLVFEEPRRLMRCYLVLGLFLWIISWIFFGLSWPFGRAT